MTADLEGRAPGRPRLAAGLLAVTAALLGAGAAVAAASPAGLTDPFGMPPGITALWAGALAGPGWLIASRRAGNPIGWLLLTAGALAGVMFVAGQFFGAIVGPDLVARLGDAGFNPFLSLPRSALLLAIASFSVFVILEAAVFLMVLLFPDGRLPSRRWRPVAWLLAVNAAVLSAASFVGALSVHAGRISEDMLDRLLLAPFVLFQAVLVLVLAAFVLRFRRSTGEQRLQLKWLLYVMAVVVVSGTVWLVGVVILDAFRTPSWMGAPVLLPLIPAAVAVAILRYRLYDIDLVISRTLVYGSLAVFISVVYIGVVVGLGQLIGTQSDNVLLAITATGIVAVAFGPVKSRIQRVANRLVFGRRTTPYQALSQFSTAMADVAAPEERLSRLARTLAEGVGARGADVWLAVGDQLRPAASWPEERGADLTVPIPLADGELPDLGEGVMAVAVVHEGELLGALAITKPATELLDPIEEELLADLAAQASLVLRNVRLTAELLDRLEELRASRQRLVAAQDEARRRLERNLHDGAQQQLVSLKVRISLAEKLAEQGKPVAHLVHQLADDTGEAIDTLRELAQGIYPPLLAAEGLPAALRAQARKTPLPVSVEAEGIGRYPQDVEAATYFCCLEALQNITKYAEASRAAISLRADTAVLTFAISDDGKGFDPARTRRGAGLQNMADRLDALDGALEVIAAPGQGVTVVGRIPTRAAVAASAP